ncbi:MAG: ROK family protein [Bryobacteraceae bacterium]
MSFSAGIDLGGTFTKLALVDSAGRVLDQQKTPSLTGYSAEEVLSSVRAKLEEMCKKTSLPYPPPLGCGIGVPGVVDYRSGEVKFGGAFKWSHVPLRLIAEKIFECSTAVDTDVNAGLLADLYFGHARDSSEMLYLSWGTGIGAGFTVNRNVYHSRGGAMGNLGHCLANSGSERKCFCGLCGCLEVEIGAAALVDKMQRKITEGAKTGISGDTELTSQRIAQAAESGDPVAYEVLGEAAGMLARALAAPLSLLNPDTVILAGGVSRCLPIVRDVFDRELARNTPAFSLANTAIFPTAFEESAGVIGAATLAAVERKR